MLILCQKKRATILTSNVGRREGFLARYMSGVSGREGFLPCYMSGWEYV